MTIELTPHYPHLAHCRECDKDFAARKPDTDICYSCWYGEQMEEANEEFRPFGEAIQNRTGLDWEVWQTGGMVMCMAIVLERDENGQAIRYLLTGSPEDHQEWGFSLTDSESEKKDDLNFESLLLTGPKQSIYEHTQQCPGCDPRFLPDHFLHFHTYGKAATPDEVADFLGRLIDGLQKTN